ncbi:MAG TPA: long-chain fatty acid--CoA ligase [Spirochaetota bacterium]|nr:long-chain fatty acid--CoA ligase [Spirochaetota bacterium]HPR47514.1 long-chain fatty acid--CoA ligase [Spirochaetota bacterium]
MNFIDFKNLHSMLQKTVERTPEKPAFSWFTEPGKRETVTWLEFYEQVKRVSKGLIALGVEKGDKVNVLSYSSYRWILSDMGIVSIGACTVGIYQSNLPEDCRYIIDHSDSVLVFAQDHTQLEKLFAIRERIPRVRKVILMRGEHPDNWVLSYDEFLALGDSVPESDFMKMRDNVHPDDIAMIVYTSGTTGIPKGAMLTHDNATFNAQSVSGCVDASRYTEQFVFLPLAHIYARGAVYYSILNGHHATFARSMDTIIDDIKEAKPQYFASVPRIFEKVYSKVVSGVEAKGGAALKIFNWARKAGYRVSDLKLEHRPIPPLLGLQYGIASALVFNKLKEALGGRLDYCISGAAPLEPTIGKFFHAADILILEGIGMTENMTFSHVNRMENLRFGWVGLPGPGIEQKIADDGELLVRGRNIMKGYYKMPEETAETITSDGWLRTGDIGRIDSEGFLKITGRKKDLIITSGGKNIAPSAIEGLLATSKYINQVCVIGDRRNYLTALVSLDADNIKDFARDNNIQYNSLDDLIYNDQIKELISAEVVEKNKSLASFESVKRVTIVPEFSIENELLTPTLKIKRNKITALYRDEIDAMYGAKIHVEVPEMQKVTGERRSGKDRRIALFDRRGPSAAERRLMERRVSMSM